MKQVKLSDSTHEKLAALSKSRKIEESFIKTNQAIVAKLIDDLYKRELG